MDPQVPNQQPTAVQQPTANQHPTGFGGAVTRWCDIASPAGAGQSLSLPRQGRRTDGRLELPPGTFDFVELLGITESMGPVEAFAHRLAAQTSPGGRLAIEVENLQAPRALRQVLEGKVASMDSVGSLRDPNRYLPLPRVLAALQEAGFLALDCYRVPSRRGETTPSLARSLFDEGFLPLAYVPGSPAWKFWIVAQHTPALAGSAIVAGGTADEREATVAHLVHNLPEGWEALTADGGDEAEAFTRGVAQSRGELLWFLRAGTRPSREHCDELVARTVLSPALPGTGGTPCSPGDLSGLMIARLDALAAGPIHGAWPTPHVAYEEWLIQLDVNGRSPAVVDVGRHPFDTPTLPIADPEGYRRDGEALMARWQTVFQGRSRVESIDDPVSRTNQAAGTPANVTAPWADREPTITLCMITRDEERFLGDCLGAIRDHVDEIVIVDTGSVDRTVAIAEEFGAKVLHRPWDDDFSAPRNTGLAAATGDWILVLDADETLTAGQGERLRELVRDPGISGYHLRFTNLYAGGKTQGVLMVRLFRNLDGIHYVNRIHEQVSPSLLRIGEPKGLILSISDLEVVHRGYADEIMASRNKNERNERLFQRQLAENPDDIYNLYKYGDFLRRIPARQRDARDALTRCLELILDQPPGAPRGMPFAGEVAALCALEYARLEDFEPAEQVLDAAFRRLTPTPNLHYIAASIAYYRGRWDDAIAHYRRCLLFGDRTLVVPIQEGVTSYVSIGGIAQCLLAKGRQLNDANLRLRGRRLLEQAIRIHPGYDVNQLALSRLYIEDGEVDRSLVTLTRYLEQYPESAAACHQATLVLRGLGLTDQARRMGEQAVALFERSAMDQEANQVKAVLAAL